MLSCAFPVCAPPAPLSSQAAAQYRTPRILDLAGRTAQQLQRLAGDEIRAARSATVVGYRNTREIQRILPSLHCDTTKCRYAIQVMPLLIAQRMRSAFEEMFSLRMALALCALTVFGLSDMAWAISPQRRPAA
jgi:hypothetical protein